MRAASLVACLAAAAVVLAGCGGSAATTGNGSGTHGRGLTIYAAASLGSVLADAAPAWRRGHPTVPLIVSTDASSALRAQIEQGAPADAFLSADRANVDRLVAAGLTDGPAVELASAGLVVVVPTANPAAIRSPADLGTAGVKIVAAGDAVPITAYARRAVAALGDRPGYPADFADRYRANVVSREDNVRAVLAKVELGEADAAIVYAPDARGSAKVTVVELPADVEAASRAEYAAAVVRGSARGADAHAFLAWLVDGDGAAILAAHGFGRP